jgi:hypothetical protein
MRTWTRGYRKGRGCDKRQLQCHYCPVQAARERNTATRKRWHVENLSGHTIKGYELRERIGAADSEPAGVS